MHMEGATVGGIMEPEDDHFKQDCWQRSDRE